MLPSTRLPGSPPRMRGKPVVAEWFALEDGTTPAHAGKTFSSGLPSLPFWDHPRACGENVVEAGISEAGKGSPPRMRGKLRKIHYNAAHKGITPAHAGKTAGMYRGWMARWDHPRACGENRSYRSSTMTKRGSPPRMRGKLRERFEPILKVGITPAHAGKTSPALISSCRLWDHPRACGENSSPTRTRISAKGSPPRMRGKLRKIHYNAAHKGITPAHAGKTAPTMAFITSELDHPRACGENVTRIMCSLPLLGSPPRMRGKLVQWPDDIRDAGITPAHAGKTETGGAVCMRSRDHPRACGENRPQRAQLHARAGSPPRMRGKRISPR